MWYTMSTGMAYVASGVVDVALDKLVLRVMDLWALNAPAATCDGVSTVIHWKSYSHDVPVVWELDMACFGTESLLTAETDGRYAGATIRHDARPFEAVWLSVACGVDATTASVVRVCGCPKE